MSAYITAQYPDCIQILTDGASYDRSGALLGVLDKCWFSKKLPFAITGRGNAHMVWKFAQAAIDFANECDSIEMLNAWIDAASVKLLVRKDDILSKEAHFELCAVSYDEKSGLSQQVFCTFHGNGVEPFKWHPMTGWIVGAPSANPDAIRKMAEEIPLSDPRFLREFGGDIMDLMRHDCVGRTSMLHADAGEFGSVVGGHCRLTTVTREGVVSEILKIWDDPIGEPINPYRHTGNVTIIGNRKARRMQKKQSKRRVA